MEENNLINFNNYRISKQQINGMDKIINLYTMMNSDLKKFICRIVYFINIKLMANFE